MFTNAKCLRALCADPRVQRGRVQWNLACVSRKGSESRAVPACAREGVSTLGELPFRVGNNGMRDAVLPSPHNASPSQTDVKKTVVAFFPFLVGSFLL